MPVPSQATVIVVVGAPRSGTTLTARLLASAPGFCYLEETGVFLRALQPQPAGERDSWARQLADAVVRHARLPEFDLRPGPRLIDRHRSDLEATDRDEIVQLSRTYLSLLSGNAIDLPARVFADLRRLSGRDGVIEKTPTQLLAVRRIRRLYPRVKICQVIRNGRDVVASYIHPSFKIAKGRNPILDICRFHNTSVSLRDTLCRDDDSHYVCVDYDELVADPVNRGRQLYDALQLPWTLAVARRLRKIHPRPSKWETLDRGQQREIDRTICKAPILPLM